MPPPPPTYKSCNNESRSLGGVVDTPFFRDESTADNPPCAPGLNYSICRGLVEITDMLYNFITAFNLRAFLLAN